MVVRSMLRTEAAVIVHLLASSAALGAAVALLVLAGDATVFAELTSPVVGRALVPNLLPGWLCWRRGLLAAIIAAHLRADVLPQVGAAALSPGT